MVKGLLVVLFVVVSAVFVTLYHLVVIVWGGRYWAALLRWLFGFYFLPLVNAARHMDADTCRAKLLSAYVAYNRLRALIIRHFKEITFVFLFLNS